MYVYFDLHFHCSGINAGDDRGMSTPETSSAVVDTQELAAEIARDSAEKTHTIGEYTVDIRDAASPSTAAVASGAEPNADPRLDIAECDRGGCLHTRLGKSTSECAGIREACRVSTLSNHTKRHRLRNRPSHLAATRRRQLAGKLMAAVVSHPRLECPHQRPVRKPSTLVSLPRSTITGRRTNCDSW